jgi:hypothetical protein
MIVLIMSTGENVIRKQDATTLANAVCTKAGKVLMYGLLSKKARMPTLAAVSQKRDTGP